MWVTLKPFRYRGVAYKVGDTVPAEGWTNRRALFVTRRIQKVPDTISELAPQASVLDPSKMKRGELNDYALSIGIENFDSYANRESLLEAVDKVLNPPLSAEDESPEDEDPFADLDEG